MEVSSREAVNSSGQLEDWAAGVAADLNEEGEDKATYLRRQAGDRDVTSPTRTRNGNSQASSAAKCARQLQEHESSPDDDNGAKQGGSRPKLPKPDKKEPCPRCHSLDTKFCYYNNYNINQPRFYCKTCQRYWTAGGTLRNIAPGSGRRKSKSKAVCRDQRNSPSLANQLTASAQTGIFGLPVSAPSAYCSLNSALLAATDPTAILANASATTVNYAHQQLAGGHGGLAGLKLPGVSHLHAGQWNNGGCLAANINGAAVLREHLHAQLTASSSMPGNLSQVASSQQGLHGLDARVLLNDNGDDVSPGSALAQVSGHLQSGQSRQSNGQHLSPPASPQLAQQQQQASSPQQPNSQTSQQPSPPHTHQHGSAISDDADAECGAEVADAIVQGRRTRRKADVDNLGSTGYTLGGAGPVSSVSAPQLAALNLPPSMASLAAVMGPAGGPTGLGGSLHPLLGPQDHGGPCALLDGAQSTLSRHNLQLALQQHQLTQQAQHLQQQESLQQLNELLPHSTVALHAHHPLLQSLAHHPGSHTAAAVAALDPVQRSALLQQAAGLGGVGWLHTGGNLFPSSLLLQVPSHSSSMNASGSTSAADWISLAAAAAACPKVHAPIATHATADSAAQVLQAHAAAFAAGGVSWPSAGSFASVPGGAPSWSLWSSYNSPASSSYAGYALQAAAAAYSAGR